MPELPDLEVFAANLTRKLSGKSLSDLKISERTSLNVSVGTLQKALLKQKLTRVYREGKELRFVFSNDAILGIHLMLHGKMTWENRDDQPVKNPLVRFSFSNGLVLTVTDIMNAVTVTLNPEKSEAPDALSVTITPSWWKKNLAASGAQIKSLLLNQKFIRGIGNAYADEILWTAGISPFSSAREIPPDKVRKLSSAVKQVLRAAVRMIKKSAPGIIGGELRDFMSVHNAHRETDPKGHYIRNSALGGRKTYYTDQQVLYK